MKKIFLALSLMMFVGTVGTSVYAATNETPTEIKKDDDKKKKKKSSKKSCASKCSTEKSAATKTGSCSSLHNKKILLCKEN